MFRRALQLCPQSISNAFRNLALDRENVGQFSIVCVRPKMRVGESINELHIHANLIVCFLHAAFENIRDAELLRNLREIIRRTFEMLSGCARNHFQIGDLGQPCENLILHPFGKKRVGFVFAQILERQHSD